MWLEWFGLSRFTPSQQSGKLTAMNISAPTTHVELPTSAVMVLNHADVPALPTHENCAPVFVGSVFFALPAIMRSPTGSGCTIVSLCISGRHAHLRSSLIYPLLCEY